MGSRKVSNIYYPGDHPYKYTHKTSYAGKKKHVYYIRCPRCSCSNEDDPTVTLCRSCGSMLRKPKDEQQ